MGTVIIAGGGTGGHLFPGLAVAGELTGRGMSCVFMGSGTPLEIEETNRDGFPFRKVRVSRRSGGLGTLPANLIQSLMDVCSCVRYFRKCRPAVVVGLGAASMIGPIAAARLTGVPRVLLEQNVLPGRATRLLCRWAAVVVTSWEKTDEFLPARVKRTFLGNPVRPEISGGSRENAARALGLDPARRTVLVLGGSQGASSLNAAAVAWAEVLGRKDIQVIHLTGKEDEATVKKTYEKAGTSSVVMAFCDRMRDAYAAADLVVSRAGGSAIAEIAVNGKAAVLVPFPYAVDGHQDLNAEAFAEGGGGIVVKEGEGFEERLRESVLSILDDRATLDRMASAGGALARPRAAADTAAEILRIAGC